MFYRCVPVPIDSSFERRDAERDVSEREMDKVGKMIVLHFYLMMDLDKGPELLTTATIDPETVTATWSVEGTIAQEILYSTHDHPVFNNGPFDPKRLDHWKAVPYLIHGDRVWATITGADAEIPQDSVMYRKAVEKAASRNKQEG